MKKVKRTIIAILIVTIACLTNVSAKSIYFSTEFDALWLQNISRSEFVRDVRQFVPKNKMGEELESSVGYDKFFRNYGKQFYDIAVQHGLNPMYIFALGIEESYYGTTIMANRNNNLFNYGAFTWAPNAEFGFVYGSILESIEDVCSLLQEYATPGTWHNQTIIKYGYSPTSIEGQMSIYSLDSSKAKSVKNIIRKVFGKREKRCRWLHHRKIRYC